MIKKQELLLGLLRPLGAIEGTGLGPSFHTSGVQSSTKDVVTHTGKVRHTTAANQHEAVLLEVVTFARDVGIDLFRVGKAYPGDLLIAELGFLGVVV